MGDIGCDRLPVVQVCGDGLPDGMGDLVVPSRSPFTVQVFTGVAARLPIGMIIKPAEEDPRFLCIDDLWSPSLISEWNRINTGAVRVLVGDIITAVNGVSGDATSMVDQLMTATHSREVTQLVLQVWPPLRFRQALDENSNISQLV